VTVKNLPPPVPEKFAKFAKFANVKFVLTPNAAA
jgi:hypothetical protein